MFNRKEIKKNQPEDKQFLDKDKDGIPDYLQKETIPSIIQNNKDLNQYELDTLQEIESFIRSLQGYEFDPTANVWVKENKAILNDYAVRKIKMHMEALVNKHSMTTDLSSDEIHKIVQYHVSELIRWFKLNFHRIDASLSDLSSIIAEFDNKCFIIMSKSIKGGQRRAITERTRITGQSQPSGGSSI